MDPLNRTFYLQLCRSLGLVHYIGDRAEVDVRSDVAGWIFNPEWVKGPAYRLLARGEALRARGVLTPSELARRLPERRATRAQGSKPLALWERLDFTETDRRYIIDLMEECELIFPVMRDGRPTGGYFVPDLLDDAPPPPAEGARPDRRAFAFIPESAFLRFLGRWHDRLHQPERTLFRDEAEVEDAGAVARVRFDREGASLLLWHRSPDADARRRLTELILAEFRGLRRQAEWDEAPGPAEHPEAVVTHGGPATKDANPLPAGRGPKQGDEVAWNGIRIQGFEMWIAGRKYDLTNSPHHRLLRELVGRRGNKVETTDLKHEIYPHRKPKKAISNAASALRVWFEKNGIKHLAVKYDGSIPGYWLEAIETAQKIGTKKEEDRNRPTETSRKPGGSAMF